MVTVSPGNMINYKASLAAGLYGLSLLLRAVIC